MYIYIPVSISYGGNFENRSFLGRAFKQIQHHWRMGAFRSCPPKYVVLGKDLKGASQVSTFGKA
jgi:hypothetical protein